MLAAKLRQADARAEKAEAAQKEKEGLASELQTELGLVRQAAAEMEARQEEAVRALQAELAELKSAVPATPEKGQSCNLEGVIILDRKDGEFKVSASSPCQASHSAVSRHAHHLINA